MLTRVTILARVLGGALLAVTLTACGGSGSDPGADNKPDTDVLGDDGIDTGTPVGQDVIGRPEEAARNDPPAVPPGGVTAGASPEAEPDAASESDVELEAEPEPEPELEPTGPRAVFDPLPSDLTESVDIYRADGYESVALLRIDLRTRTQAGVCTGDDESGCTLADVLADTDHNDDIKIDIPVHVVASDFPDDGLFANAELRQRGGTTRLAPQKSFRIELNKKAATWRGERKLQLNKHPYEATRTRNKLAMDLMADMPHLMSFRTQFANLWIDDGAGPVDYGVFTHIEAPGNRWLERRGLSRGDNLYKVSRFAFSTDNLEQRFPTSPTTACRSMT